MSDKLFKQLKWVAQYLLPALGTLYFALSGIWGLPYGEQVVGTFSALTVFLGVVLGISSAQYDKIDRTDGDFVIDTTDPNKDIYRLDLTTGFDVLKDKDQIKLKVNKSKGSSVYTDMGVNESTSRYKQGL